MDLAAPYFAGPRRTPRRSPLFTQGTALTGLESPNGSNVTGHWVADGQQFSLRAPNGLTLATVTARVNCIDLPLWPLAVGNS